MQVQEITQSAEYANIIQDVTNSIYTIDARTLQLLSFVHLCDV